VESYYLIYHFSVWKFTLLWVHLFSSHEYCVVPVVQLWLLVLYFFFTQHKVWCTLNLFFLVIRYCYIGGLHEYIKFGTESDFFAFDRIGRQRPVSNYFSCASRFIRLEHFPELSCQSTGKLLLSCLLMVLVNDGFLPKWRPDNICVISPASAEIDVLCLS
jgi:hypothetical protein